MTAFTDSDGRFQLGPLPPVDVDVYHVDAADHDACDFATHPYGPLGTLLGHVTMPARGDVAVAYDLGARLPGWLHVTVRVNGEPTTKSLRPCLLPEDGTRRAIGGMADRSPDGLGFDIGPLPPTTATLVVCGESAPWMVTAPDRVVITAGQSTDRVIDIDLVESSILCLDEATGAPLAQHSILLRSADGQCNDGTTHDGTTHDGTTHDGTTDEEGRLSLSMPVGTELRVGPAAAGPNSGMPVSLLMMLHGNDMAFPASVVRWTSQGADPPTLKVRVMAPPGH